MKNTAILILLTILFLGCDREPEKILIIGDSISIGYTPHVKEALSGKATVVHNEGNAGNTGMGLEKIHDWLGDEKWDRIIFNWGLWDLCYWHPASKVQGEKKDKINGTLTFTPEEYGQNLDSLVRILKTTGARLMFVTTTCVPDGEPGRIQGDEQIYNSIALEVMSEYGIQVIDLNKYSYAIHSQYGKQKNDVHYTEEGYRELANIIVSAINGDQAGRPVDRPNILFILADDLGAKDLSCTGSEFYETPNIDLIAGHGMIFTQGYANCQVCSPSRASIMTGKFPARHGITDWIGAISGEAWRETNHHSKLLPAEYIHNIPDAEFTLAEALKASGYKTFFAGKWHLGSKGSYPEDHGFEVNKGGWEKGSPIGGFYSPWENPRLENRIDGENLSMRLALETASFIEDNKDSAFFAFLSFYSVHAPIQTTREKWSKYRDKAEKNGIADTGYKMERYLPIRQVQDNPVYAGLVESMDDAVGIVLQSLKDMGLEEKTIVIFTSDNGGVASGDDYSTSNLPLRGGKGYQWEGGIREPYFIRVPWLESNGATNNYPVTGTDFYPTILDLANIDPIPGQHVDGVSLKPLLEGYTLPERTLYWHYPHYGDHGGEPSSIIREKDWKLIHYWEDGRNELYNLQSDPGELADVSGKYPSVTERLSENLLSWLMDVNARMPARDETYDPVLDSARDAGIVNELWPELEKKRMELLSKDFDPGNDWWGSMVTGD